MTSDLRHYKRRWSESRGDDFDRWGASDWYFEVGADGWPVRQIERYDDGTVLKYDVTHVEDEYGGLSEAALDPAEYQEFAIGSAEFETMWASEARNRPRGA